MTANAPEPAAAGSRGTIAAIGIMCLASLCFIAMHGFIKSVRGDVPVGVILWSQFAFQSIMLSAAFARRLPRILVPHMLGRQIARALAQIATIGLMFVAVGLMQLADAIAISFIAPLLITALSVAFLGETVQARHWLAILVGFGGVVIVIQPGAGIFNAAALVPLGAACCAAVYQAMTRPIARAVGPATMLYTATLVGLVTSSAALPFFWQMPDPGQIAYLFAAACFGVMAHFFLIKAYQMAPASVVAPFSYSELIWASVIGLAAFGDVPTATTLVGGAVLAASGLYLLRRQYD